MIDFHVHIGNMYRERYPAHAPLSPQQLIDRMNREGIVISVLLPLESPEGSWGYFLTEEAVAARDLYPERLIAFCCVDPRYPLAAEFIEHFVRQRGCKGFGEHVNGLAFDDERNKISTQSATSMVCRSCSRSAQVCAMTRLVCRGWSAACASFAM